MSQLVTQTKPASASPDGPHTAVIYLRVSSDGQVNKAHNPEGYSIPAQREACERHAAGLGAEVIAEFVELGRTGTNLRRPALQSMLSKLPKLKPTYVVFYDLSRVAREEQDAFWLLGEIKRHGAKLESTLERIDDSPQGLLLFAIMAGVNAFRSRGDAEKVKMGLRRKFAEGGSIGKVPIGYLNSRERIDGREIRTVSVDPERAPLIRTAFEAYATGEYSITDLRDLLDEGGLRTRHTPKCRPAPLSRTQIHRMLSDDFYIGVVTWDGAKNPDGRHDPLIAREIFEKVQEVLHSALLSGNRTRKHKHYLRGSVFCGRCGRRMVFHRVSGKGGVYHYFRCLSHQGRREPCGARHTLVSTVEQAVERYYATVRLTPREQANVRHDVRTYAEEKMLTATRESQRHTRRLQELRREQNKLLSLYYKGSVDEELLASEQTRIDRESAEAQHWAEVATHDAGEIMDTVNEALQLLNDPQIAYKNATPEVRRLLNQTLFEALLVREEDVTGAKPTPWVAQIHRLAGSALDCPDTIDKPKGGGQDDHGPFSGAVGFSKAKMVPRAGLEPAPPD
jgi:site-specific DNA recombinase